jgi:cellulose synthase/poly-beta-1,6-N-acetylglucosamine synthase-like glycosyltransferase
LAVLEAIAIICGVTVIYVYAVYPLLLGLLARRRRAEPSVASQACPEVTLVIPAYNEAKIIRQKLDNSLAIDAPCDRLEILVASDGSDDETNEIARDYENQGVKLAASPTRCGKISALNRAIPEASDDIVVLCDANVMFDPDAIRRLARHFTDLKVGAVTGDVRIQSEDAPFGESEGLYYKYERAIQRWESAIGSIVGVDGGMYAIRKELFRPLPADTILDDFVISMNIARAGYRVIYDPTAVATENATLDVRQEFRRKVRIVAGGFRELLRGEAVPGIRQLQLLWSYVSHKLLRWLVPWFLLILLACSAALAVRAGPRSLLAVLLYLQIAFYSLALIGCTRPNAHWPALIGVPFYFSMVNAAAWLGSIRGVLGIEKVTWKKADR